MFSMDGFVNNETVGCCSLKEVVQEDDWPTVHSSQDCVKAGHLVKEINTPHMLIVVWND
jgi:hypothetical protein